jgi:hypothetical protein
MLKTDPATGFPEGAFSGPIEFAQLVRDALALAAAQGWRELVFSDSHFEEWPLRERVVVESLQAWAGQGRKLTLLAHSFDAIPRLHPRFVTWRKQWDHIIDCRVCKQVDVSEFPSAIWSPAWCMRRLDLMRSTGMAGAEPIRRQRLKEELDECRRYSAPGFSATILGL